MKGIASPRIFLAVVVLAALLVVSAAPAAPVKVTESLVSPSAIRFPKNKQNESPMVVNPLNPKVAITGANDEINEPDCTPATGGPSSCPFVLGVDTTGVYFTKDGGATWHQTILDWCPNDDPTDPNCLLISDGDPVVAIGPKPGPGGFGWANGVRVYFGSLAGSPNFGPDKELIAVSFSDDCADASVSTCTFGAPVTATTRENPVNFNDKIAIWADQNLSSPHFGNVYVSWTLFTGTFPAPSFGREGPVFLPEPILFTRSTDGGVNYEAPRKLTPSHNNGAVGGRQGSTIRSAPNGDLYVFWDDALFQTSAVLGARSTDGGVNFSRPFLVSFKSDVPPSFPGASFRTNSFPMADVDASGNLYVVWPNYTNGHAVVKLAKSTDNGASWSVSTAADVTGRSAFFPAVAVSGGNVFIGFNAIDDKPAGSAAGADVVFYDAYYALSTNGGAAFGGPVKISKRPSDPDASSTNSLGAQFIGDYNGAAAGSDGTFWFSWTDTRNGSTCAAIDAFRAGTGPRPNIYDSCPEDFGNSDIFVARVTP